MSRYNFDQGLNLRKTRASRYAGLPEDTILMTIADMTFPLMPEVAEAVAAHLTDPGYIFMEDEDYATVIDWCRRRFGYTIPREHLLATPGVLYTTRCAMYALTKPGDRVIIQPPLHTPSIASASMQGRIPLRNEFRRTPDGGYTFDLENLEACFQSGGRVLMMCAPNNPTGRVWTKPELEAVAELVQRYDAYVVTDEIHRDIVWPGHTHVSIGNLPGMENRTVTAFSTSKTFNMGGFHIGSAVIPNPDLRKAVEQELYVFGHACGRPSTPCIAAQTAAYRYGEPWLEEMLAYVDGNMNLAMEMLADTPIHASHPEGSFLMWADITELGFDNVKLEEWCRELHLYFDPGHYYDTKDYQTYRGPEHHIRLNMAMPRQDVETALERIRKYFRG